MGINSNCLDRLVYNESQLDELCSDDPGASHTFGQHSLASLLADCGGHVAVAGPFP